MKNLLSLTLALMLAFTANSYADNTESSDSQVRKERKYENRNTTSKTEKANMSEKRNKGQRSEEVRNARKECLNKCNVDVEAVKACRKEKGFEKGEGDGSCVSDANKECMRQCKHDSMKGMKDSSAKQNKSEESEKSEKRNRKSKEESN